MKAVIAGHLYELDDLKSDTKTSFRFHMDPKIHDGMELSGPSCQEVVRMLIDRVEYLESEKHWAANAEIIRHLRCVIALFEARALIRKVDEDKLAIEHVALDKDGHLKLQ